MSGALNRGETLGAPIQKYADIALPSNPKLHTVSKSDSVADWEPDVRRELGLIKGELENLIFWRRSGQVSTWWTASQEATAKAADTKLSHALAEWKSKWAAKGVDVEKVLREVFTSPMGRVWEQDPSVKALARAWAGL
jgi:hypothetical protein